MRAVRVVLLAAAVAVLALILDARELGPEPMRSQPAPDVEPVPYTPRAAP